jgi:hypothetical protein
VIFVNFKELAMGTLLQKNTPGIPAAFVNLMQHEYLERLAKARPGQYRKDPVKVYVDAQRNMGIATLDQFIPENPLTMENAGYKNKTPGATTGLSVLTLDGMAIDSPEAVAEHLFRFEFPAIKKAIASFDEDARAEEILLSERKIQDILGDDILKTGYGTVGFPHFEYGKYGYVNYFSAYALYPEVIEKHFSLFLQ